MVNEGSILNSMSIPASTASPGTSSPDRGMKPWLARVFVKGQGHLSGLSGILCEHWCFGDLKTRHVLTICGRGRQPFKAGRIQGQTAGQRNGYKATNDLIKHCVIAHHLRSYIFVPGCFVGGECIELDCKSSKTLDLGFAPP